MFDIRDYYTQIWEIVKMLVGPFYKKKGANIVILSSQTSSHIANMKMSTFSTLFVVTCVRWWWWRRVLSPDNFTQAESDAGAEITSGGGEGGREEEALGTEEYKMNS